MRVTGIIKDYITSEVDKKYQEKIKKSCQLAICR